jgi:hypothetical protein
MSLELASPLSALEGTLARSNATVAAFLAPGVQVRRRGVGEPQAESIEGVAADRPGYRTVRNFV